MQETEIYEKFIEGDLTPENEKKFMARLTLDDELRTNFRHYLVVTNSIKNYVENEKLPISVSNSVFTALGFSPILENPGKIHQNKPSFFRGKFFTAFVTALSTFILAFFLFKFNGSVIDEKKNTTNLINQKDEIPLVKIDKKDDYQETVKGYRTKSVLVSKNDQNFVKVLVENNSIPDDNSVAYKEISPSLFSMNEISRNSFQDFEKNKFSDNRVKPIAEYSSTKYDTLIFYRSYDSKIRFEFKNTPSWFSSSPIVQPNRLNNFNNLSVSFLYPITKTILIGAEFRQETFYINYDDKEKSGQDFTYYMQPNLSTYGISIRYLPIDLCRRIKPFCQIEIGGNSAGLVSREMLGLEFQLFENAYLTIGGEVNQFCYHHLNNWYTSSKYNINYGVGLKF
jgi:hypothetical protein